MGTHGVTIFSFLTPSGHTNVVEGNGGLVRGGCWHRWLHRGGESYHSPSRGFYFVFIVPLLAAQYSSPQRLLLSFASPLVLNTYYESDHDRSVASISTK